MGSSWGWGRGAAAPSPGPAQECAAAAGCLLSAGRLEGGEEQGWRCGTLFGEGIRSSFPSTSAANLPRWDWGPGGGGLILGAPLEHPAGLSGGSPSPIGAAPWDPPGCWWGAGVPAAGGWSPGMLQDAGQGMVTPSGHPNTWRGGDNRRLACATRFSSSCSKHEIPGLWRTAHPGPPPTQDPHVEQHQGGCWEHPWEGAAWGRAAGCPLCTGAAGPGGGSPALATALHAHLVGGTGGGPILLQHPRVTPSAGGEGCSIPGWPWGWQGSSSVG